MGVQVGCGLSAQAGTQAVDEVGTDHRIHRTYVHLAGIPRLYEIFHQQFQSPQDVFESTRLLHTL